MRRHIIHAMACLASLVGLTEQARADIIRHYRFEEGGGTAIVDSVRGLVDGSHNAAYSSSVPVSPLPQTGQSNQFSLNFNSSASATFPSQDFIFHRAFGDATLEFWGNLPQQPTVAGSLFWTRTDATDNNRFNLQVNTLSGVTFLGFDYREPGGDLHTLLPGDAPFGIAGPLVVTLDTWTHVAITRDGNTYQFYRDGVLIHTATDVNPNLPDFPAWTLNGRPGSSFVGLVDELRFSDRALSTDEFLRAPSAAIPEPSSLTLFGLGVVTLMGYARCRWRQARFGPRECQA
jgi:hypothetical protein